MKPQKKGRRKGVCHLEQKLNNFGCGLSGEIFSPFSKKKVPTPLHRTDVPKTNYKSITSSVRLLYWSRFFRPRNKTTLAVPRV